MKSAYRSISFSRLCWLLGVSRQAFYQYTWQVQSKSEEQALIIEQVRLLRELHPAMGTRKLYVLLQPFLTDKHIKIGRDALFDLLSVNKLLVRKRKRKFSTTNSHHWLKKYPNLIKEWRPEKPQQLWVADITYLPVKNHFLYLSLITDACSHKIMGYHIANTLEAVHTLKALQMALQNSMPSNELIHHSDRGIQYCSSQYVHLLQENRIRISMSEKGDPLENPIAERINGIIKNEYLNHYPIEDTSHALQLLHAVVNRYNHQRPHQSIAMLTPEIVHQKQLSINRKWTRKKLLPNIVNL